MEENLRQTPINKGTTILKIALFGPESTGKTTLASQLAAHYDTVWTPEFARDYLQEKWNKHQQICEPEDLLPIAIGQTKLENETLLTANKYLKYSLKFITIFAILFFIRLHKNINTICFF